jgi:hypothetical protein
MIAVSMPIRAERTSNTRLLRLFGNREGSPFDGPLGVAECFIGNGTKRTSAVEKRCAFFERIFIDEFELGFFGHGQPPKPWSEKIRGRRHCLAVDAKIHGNPSKTLRTARGLERL